MASANDETVSQLAVKASTHCIAGKWMEAADLYSKALSVDRESLVLRHCLGFVLMCAGRYAEAEIVYGDALSLLPGNATSMHGLGAAMENRLEMSGVEDPDKYAQCAWLIRNALEIRPNDLLINRDLARAYWMWGKIKEAYDTYLRALWIAPFDELALKNWRQLLFEKDMYPLGIDSVKSFIDEGEAKGTGVGPLWWILAHLYQDIDEKKEAIRCYQEAILRQPTSLLIYEALQSLQMESDVDSAHP